MVQLIAFLKGEEGAEGMRKAAKKVGEEIQVSYKDVDVDSAEAAKFGIEMTPALVIEGERPYGTFYGVPRGREEKTFKEVLKMVASGDSDLPQDTRDRLKEIDSDTYIRIFTTPQCTYCPKAVKVAFGFAMENPKVKAETVDATEFDELAFEYKVTAVPTIVLNNTVTLAHQGNSKDYIKKFFGMIEHLEGHHK